MTALPPFLLAVTIKGTQNLNGTSLNANQDSFS